MNWDSLTRRKMLAGLGGAGAVSVVGIGVGTKGSVQYTSAQSTETCPDFILNADWRETYTRDGQTTLLENTTAQSGGPTGTENTASEPGIIRLENILPGDRGTVGFRIRAEQDNSAGNTDVTPELSINIREDAENGINNPEQEANDTSPNDGELDEFLDAKVWNDDGLFGDLLGVDDLGAENLEQNITEPTISEGSLRDVANNVNDEELGTINSTTDESVAVAFRWEFADDANINVTQGDSVTFEFKIDCGGS